MSSVNQPFGLRPALHLTGGTLRRRALYGGINSGYAANILNGQAVLIDPTLRTILPVLANNVDFVGCFDGVDYTDATGNRKSAPNWTSGTVATNIIAYFYDDPKIIYEIQADGSLAQVTSIGFDVALTNFAAGNTTIGYSQETCSATPATTGVQAQLQIVDLAYGPDNAWGDAFTVVRVRIARHQFEAVKVSI